VRIAQVSPLYESVPPQAYGGTERVVAYLTDELVRLGHEVTLFASGDSTTTAELVPLTPHSLRLDPDSVDTLAHHVLLVERVAAEADRFDIIHFHIDYLHFPISRRGRYTHVTTLHGRLDIPDLQPLYREYQDMPVVSISDAQRVPVPHANWQATVPHGLPAETFPFGDGSGGYLAFLGRISPEKRVDRAVEIARRTGMRLRVAAKVDAADRQYFETEIAPLFELPFVDFIGEIDEVGKRAFLGDARALLFPIDWREPFGLVMIEAMSCGTPVVAWRGGSVDEVIRDGVSGFIVEHLDDAVDAVHRIAEVDRRQCRAEFEERFTADRMARDYVEVYEQIISGRTPTGPRVVDLVARASVDAELAGASESR
jgi:glycosyltransferase involved in cell wall biosynthesis